MAVPKREKTNINGKDYYATHHKSPIKAIREFCLICMGMTRTQKDPPKPFDDVKTCTDELCALFDFRFGRNPHRRVSPKQHAASLKNIQAARSSRDETTQNRRSTPDEYQPTDQTEIDENLDVFLVPD